MGGFFELNTRILRKPKLKKIENVFNLEHDDILLNSGRCALSTILLNINLKMKYILVPDYFCGETIIPILQKNGCEYRFYSINERLELDKNFIIEELKNKNIGAILLINYFGIVKNNQIIKTIKSIRNDVHVILDCAQDLYEPIMVDKTKQLADYIFVSFRKFLETPDGSFVRSKKLFDIKMDKNRSLSNQAFHQTIGSILKYDYLHYYSEVADDKNLENIFLKYINNSKIDNPNRVPLSNVTLDIIERLDLDEYARIRKRNYDYLSEHIVESPLITPLIKKRNENCIPMTFPVIVKNNQRDELRNFFRKENILCPIHWPLYSMISDKIGKTAETLYRNILSFPIDQRYGLKEMEIIIDKLKKFKFIPLQ